MICGWEGDPKESAILNRKVQWVKEGIRLRTRRGTRAARHQVRDIVGLLRRFETSGRRHDPA